MIGRPKVPLVLTTPEQQALDSLAHRARTAPQVARRARIVLACARGLDNQTVAKKLRVSPQMVGRWRARFVTRRVDGLLDARRPGAPRTITDDTVETVIVRTLETTPDGATHWSTRTLAKATGLSHGTIARIWRAFGLQPHRTKTFTLSPDPLLVEKVRDVVGLKRMKLFTSIGDPKTESLYKQFGFQVVPLSMVDLVTSLQTGMIDAIPNVPLFAQLQELHKLTPHMLNVKLTPRSTAGRHSLPGVALDLHAVVHVVHPQDLRVSTIRP